MMMPIGFPKLPEDFETFSEAHDSFDRSHSIFFHFFRKKQKRVDRVLFVVHGLGEHGGRYAHFPHYLGDVYDLMIAIDLRGHGRSSGIRGHVDRFDEYVDDVMLGFSIIEKKFSEAKRIDLLGHSMGGLVVLRTLFFQPELPIQHAIISGPALGSKVPVPIWKDLMARGLSRIWASLQLDTGIDPQLISHDAEVVKAYCHDRLVHGKASPSFYVGILSAMQELHDRSIQPKADTRLLFQLAGEDGIVDIQKTELFFDRLRHEEKKLIVYPGLYHEIYNETTKELVLEDVLRFVKGNR